MPVKQTGTAVLSTRALNRALLARQLLLQRSTLTPTKAIEHLVGLQAQAPNPPYYALWSRVEGFTPDHLSTLLLKRRVVRIALMRSTVHLVTARDVLTLRPLMQPVQDVFLHSRSPYGRALAGLDFDHLTTATRALLHEKPRTTNEIGALLHAKWRTGYPAAYAFAMRNLLALVQVPPRGVWGKGGLPLVATVEAWLGKPLDKNASLDQLILRYLRAFGPASPSDFHTWSGLSRTQELFEKLRPKLRVFRDEDGRELFDVRNAPRPSEESAAPPRFLGEYDNILLSHAKRTRIVPDHHRHHLASKNGQVPGTILVDGFVRGLWKITRKRAGALLQITPFEKLTRKQRGELTEEGEALLGFAAADAADRHIQFTAVK